MQPATAIDYKAHTVYLSMSDTFIGILISFLIVEFGVINRIDVSLTF